MSLAGFFPEILAAHVGAAMLSGTLFALRGIARLAEQPIANHPALRYFSYLNDTILLIAAIALTVIIHQYPLVNAWLTVKVLLLVLYIVLGVVALRRGRTRRVRAIAYVVALATFALILSVAVTRSPWGVLAGM